MNVSRLRELIDLLVQRDREPGMEQILNQLTSQLQTLTQQPQNANHQQQVSATLNNLSSSWKNMTSGLTPADVMQMEEIGAGKYFFEDWPTEFAQIIRDNAATMETARQKISQMVGERQGYMHGLKQLQPVLDQLGIKPAKLPAGETEIGVVIPENLFGGRLDEFAKELSVLNTVIRTLSEVTIGSAEQPRVRQISSSNPEIFLALSLPVTLAVSRTVTWAIDTWKKVEEIRKIRAETQKLKSFSEEEVQEIFDKKIKMEIDLAIEEQVSSMIANSKAQARQLEEMRSWLDWVLRSFLSRIERGMTVEIRFSEPPQQKGDEKSAKTHAAFEELKAEAQRLRFPPAQQSPVLELPSPNRPAPKKKA
jgi:hypothetical protein